MAQVASDMKLRYSPNVNQAMSRKEPLRSIVFTEYEPRKPKRPARYASSIVKSASMNSVQ
jgi:hypothetical protein